MTVNNGYYPHGRAMFSPQALAAFKQFVKIDNATAAQRPKGAQDAQHPRLARAIARDRKLARDQMTGAPDSEVVNMILEALKESLPDAGVVAVMKALDDKWPGCAGKMVEPGEHADDDFVDEKGMTDDDFPSQTELADADEPSGNPNRNRDYSGRGSEAFRVANDDPPDFPGMPKTGGKMVPMKREMSMDSAMDDYERCFPMAKRIGLDPTPGSGSHSAAVTPTTMRTSRRGLAMDQKQYASGAAEDYARLFGSSNVRVL